MAKDSKAKTTVKKLESSKNFDYKSLGEEELLKKIATMRNDLAVLKKSTVMGDVQNVRAYGYARKELARALTSCNQVREVK